MSTSSRGISKRLHHHRASHTPGRTKGGNCVRPKDCGLAISGNPYKGAGLKGNAKSTYIRLWDKYKSAKGNA